MKFCHGYVPHDHHRCDCCDERTPCSDTECEYYSGCGFLCDACDASYYHASCIQCHSIVAGCMCEPESEPQYQCHSVQEEQLADAYEAQTPRWTPYAVGDNYCVFAGAPGTGRHVYLVTRVDRTGIYGVTVENTIRELEPYECV